MKAWHSSGAPKSILIMGVPFYGRSFTLQNRNENGVGAPATAGKAGKFTREAGFLAFYEVKETGFVQCFPRFAYRYEVLSNICIYVDSR